jgi:hypothetical protein
MELMFAGIVLGCVILVGGWCLLLWLAWEDDDLPTVKDFRPEDTRLHSLRQIEQPPKPAEWRGYRRRDDNEAA